MASFDDKFKLSIQRKIEPGMIKVFDICQQEYDDNDFPIYFKILSMRDEEFFIDNVLPSIAA